MKIETYFLSLANNQLHVTQYGNGSRLLLIFHGYAQSAKDYKDFSQTLQNQFTVVVPDLPFHGQTNWKKGSFTQKILTELVCAILEKNNHKSTAFLGFSMGGRLLLSLLQDPHPFIDRVVLLAPEGLKPNYWFGLATRTILGKWLFRKVTRSPSFFIEFIDIAEKLRLVNTRMASFVKTQIGTKENRNRIYQLWNTLRDLTLNRKKLKSTIQKESWPIWLCLGKYDRLVPSQNAQSFDHIPNIKIEVIDNGHGLLAHQKVVEKVQHFLLSGSGNRDRENEGF